MTRIPKVEQVPSKKPGSRAPVGAMVRIVLGLLCLFLAPAEASKEGEVCLVWLRGPIKALLLFCCQQRPDGTPGRFCCGTCIAPYCCDFMKARLDQDQDQDQCWDAAWRMLKVFVGAATTPTARPKTVPTDVVLGLVVTVLTAALLILMFFWKCCPEGSAPCLGCYRRGKYAPLEFPMVVYSDPRLENFDPSPPYEEIPPQLPYSQVAPSNCSHDQDGATAGPRGPTLSGGGSEEATTQSTTTSGATSAPGPTDEPAAAGDITPELGAAAAAAAAAAAEVTPVQEAASLGKSTAAWDPAGGGEGASRVMSSALGVITTQPAPMEKRIPGFPRVSWKIKESEM